jgi:class 3 adenylate cyclase/pimeloyl-ACP methyl ester carboxylesterase
VTDVPETLYATADGFRLAYQVLGSGQVDVLVDAPRWLPVDLMREQPSLARFLDRLSSFCRHLWFDPGGTGASGPLIDDQERFFETLEREFAALLDHVSWEQAVVLNLMGASSGLLFAAAHPERVRGVVMLDPYARLLADGDYPDGYPGARLDEVVASAAHDWGTGFSLFAARDVAGDEALARWVSRCERLSMTPEQASRRIGWANDVDVREILPSVQAPVLVLSRLGGRRCRLSRWLAEQLPNGRLVEVGGEGNLFFTGDTAPMLDAIEEFVTGKLKAPDAHRVLATVLFTDIVGSTRRAAELGDRRWRDLIESHDAITRTVLDRYQGQLIKTTGDGALATFDGPGRAIRCATNLRDGLGALGIQVRAGLHTGEIELRDDDIGGIAVHIAQRVQAFAEPGEVLVSETVPRLVTGSGIEFAERGEHELKGVPGTWKLYAVEG